MYLVDTNVLSEPTKQTADPTVVACSVLMNPILLLTQ
jgi:predicted nucleic acid-binding protein